MGLNYIEIAQTSDEAFTLPAGLLACKGCAVPAYPAMLMRLGEEQKLEGIRGPHFGLTSVPILYFISSSGCGSLHVTAFCASVRRRPLLLILLLIALVQP